MKNFFQKQDKFYDYIRANNFLNYESIMADIGIVFKQQSPVYDELHNNKILGWAEMSKNDGDYVWATIKSK